MSTATDDDPYLWLEDVHAAAAVAWARERTAQTDAAFASPARDALADRLRGILEDPDRIAVPARRGQWMYELWKDADNPRGLWRRAARASFLAGAPEWRVLLDVDALGRAEGRTWAFAGAVHGPRGTERALVQLSADGGDAHVVREFDLATAAFVAGGFTMPADKSHSAWLDEDTLLVAATLDGGGATDSGYPLTARIWSRGTPLADAPVITAAAPADVAVGVHVDRTGGLATAEVSVSHDFFHDEVSVWDAAAPPDPRHVGAPQDALVDVHGELVAVRTTTPWTVGGATHPGGTLLVGPLRTLTGGDGSGLAAVFTPSARRVLRGWRWTRTRLVLTVLDEVRSRILAADPAAAWEVADITPAVGAEDDLLTVSAVTADPDEDDEVWLAARGFLTPPTLVVTDAAAPAPRVVDRDKAVFDVTGLAARQHWATSADGTRIPYFQVGPRDAAGPLPTLLSGYGGFEVSELPEYPSMVGPAWLEPGRVYVVANIRGGGEFGPAWHLSAMRENRPRAYEDFVAVARDLVARGVTTPSMIGCHGGSNGGLLVGNMLTRYPDDFGAVVCGVPLLDMRRYTRLSAGASWIAEYGDPDDPADWAFLRTFSPYHLIDPARSYPPTLLYAATSDDRVGPAQARKMAARLAAETDAEVHYLEQDEGGHGAAIDAAARAGLQATLHAFLARTLTPRPEG